MGCISHLFIIIQVYHINTYKIMLILIKMEDSEIKKRLGYDEHGLEISETTLGSVRTALHFGVSMVHIQAIYKCGLYDSHDSKNYSPKKGHIPEIALQKPSLEQTVQSSESQQLQTPSNKKRVENFMESSVQWTRTGD